jgi:integrase
MEVPVDAFMNTSLQIPIWMETSILDPVQHDDAQCPLVPRKPTGDQDTFQDRTSTTFMEFVEQQFIPEYVMKRRVAGRAHFQAILKHILPPHRIVRAFGADKETPRVRLSAVPGWPYLDTSRLGDVTLEKIQQLIHAALTHGYSAQTVTHMRNVIRAIFCFAIECGYYAGTNPASLAAAPKIDRKRGRPSLTLEELKQVIKLMRHPEKDIALFALLTGMNVAEICGLKWQYVNLSNDRRVVDDDVLPSRSIAVRLQNYRGEFRPVAAARKRLITVQEPLLSVLHDLKARTPFTGRNHFVISSRAGTAINPDNVAIRRLKSIGKILNLPWLSWKVFRRTRDALIAQIGRHFNRELERVLPLRCAS